MPFYAIMQIGKNVRKLIRDKGKIVVEALVLSPYLGRDDVECLPLVEHSDPEHHCKDDCPK